MIVYHLLDCEQLRLPDLSSNVVSSEYRLVENAAAECQSFSGENQKE